MKLVTENSPEDLARRAAEGRFEWALVQLTANLLRITRGAGKGYEVRYQVVELAQALQDHWDAFGHWPQTEAFNDALRLRDERDADWDFQWRVDAINQIIHGSLQIAASRLLDQPLHISRGQRELDAGLRCYGEWEDEMRKRRQARDRADRSASKVPKIVKSRSKKT